jgi:hypothetical protein
MNSNLYGMLMLTALIGLVLIFAWMILKSIYRVFVPAPPPDPAAIRAKRRQARLVTIITLTFVFGTEYFISRYNSGIVSQGNISAPAEDAPREDFHRSKFNSLIRRKKIAIGMTENDVRAAWGEPDLKNNSISASGAALQFIYSSNRLVNFDRGKVANFKANER